ECVPAGVAIPRRMTIQKPPVTFAKDRFLQPGKQQRVELLDLLVHRFLGTAAEMHRDLGSLTLELALMEETKPGRQESDDSRCPVHVEGESRGRAGLIVILQETRKLVLVIKAGQEMVVNRARMSFAQAVVEALVVSVVEAVLLQRPFQIPV